MCYSGKCRREGHMEDCLFPMYIKEVKEKYKHPNCDIGIQTIEEQQFNDEVAMDIKNIIRNRNKSE